MHWILKAFLALLTIALIAYGAFVFPFWFYGSYSPFNIGRANGAQLSAEQVAAWGAVPRAPTLDERIADLELRVLRLEHAR